MKNPSHKTFYSCCCRQRIILSKSLFILSEMGWKFYLLVIWFSIRIANNTKSNFSVDLHISIVCGGGSILIIWHDQWPNAQHGSIPQKQIIQMESPTLLLFLVGCLFVWRVSKSDKLFLGKQIASSEYLFMCVYTRTHAVRTRHNCGS